VTRRSPRSLAGCRRIRPPRVLAAIRAGGRRHTAVAGQRADVAGLDPDGLALAVAVALVGAILGVYLVIV